MCGPCDWSCSTCQIVTKLLMVTSLTGRLKCAGTSSCIKNAPTADRFLDCTSKTG